MATLDTERFELHLPPRSKGAVLDQDEEWCEIVTDGERRRIRLHDYAEIFDVPGLYEQLFSEMLECTSPEVVCDLLREALDDGGANPATMAALDFGAGNGMIGEQLDDIGFGTIVGAQRGEVRRAVVVVDVGAVAQRRRLRLGQQVDADDRAEADLLELLADHAVAGTEVQRRHRRRVRTGLIQRLAQQVADDLR